MGLSRRYCSVIFSVLLVFGVLLYTDHPAVRPVKSAVAALGLIDSRRAVHGITDIRAVDHVRGDIDADIVLLEYSDFDCAMCALMRENFDRLIREENMLVVSRHLYVSDASSSFDRAVAAECVAKHGDEDMYFAFSRYLYETQYDRTGDSGTPAGMAASLGVDPRAFNSCVESDEAVRERVRSDSEEGWRLGARGTPYIVVVYGDRPIGISYANRYDRFLDRIHALVREARR